MLQDVSDKQQALLTKVTLRLQEVSRRRAEIANLVANNRVREEEEAESTNQRRSAIDADIRAAEAERERIEQAITAIALRREEQLRINAQQSADREKARLALEEEQREVAILEQRVAQLRAEMTRHLDEEEQRFAQRVREAEEARRRSQQDAEQLSSLEAKIAQTEQRVQQRRREEETRSMRRSREVQPPVASVLTSPGRNGRR